VTSPRVAAGVSDAVAPPPGNPRFPLLDALRAVAVLSVLLFHASGAQHGGISGDVLTRLDVGVAIFFVLSGFLIYRPFVNARMLGAPPVRIGAFARRRALRILPAYWLALTLVALWPGLTGVFTADWWKFYGLLQIYDFDTTVEGLGVAWSLCIEVSFYAVLPLYAAATALTLRGRPLRTQVRIELAALALLSVVSLALRYHLREDEPLSPALHTLPSFLFWFALGMGMAVLSVLASSGGAQPRLARAVERAPVMSWALAAVAFAVLAFGVSSLKTSGVGPAALGFVGGTEDLELHVLYGLVAALLVLPAVFGASPRSVPGRVLAWAPLAWVGLISYALFLYQLPVVQRLDKAGLHELIVLSGGAAVVAGAIAAASYYGLERPLLRFKS
jgi:peptidoglycan/LPS O-acetylase OafA/YrhL